MWYLQYTFHEKYFRKTRLPIDSSSQTESILGSQLSFPASPQFSPPFRENANRKKKTLAMSPSQPPNANNQISEILAPQFWNRLWADECVCIVVEEHTSIQPNPPTICSFVIVNLPRLDPILKTGFYNSNSKFQLPTEPHPYTGDRRRTSCAHSGFGEDEEKNTA